jgi:hypothetical protein
MTYKEAMELFADICETEDAVNVLSERVMKRRIIAFRQCGHKANYEIDNCTLCKTLKCVSENCDNAYSHIHKMQTAIHEYANGEAIEEMTEIGEVNE